MTLSRREIERRLFELRYVENKHNLIKHLVRHEMFVQTIDRMIAQDIKDHLEGNEERLSNQYQNLYIIQRESDLQNNPNQRWILDLDKNVGDALQMQILANLLKIDTSFENLLNALVQTNIITPERASDPSVKEHFFNELIQKPLVQQPQIRQRRSAHEVLPEIILESAGSAAANDHSENLHTSSLECYPTVSAAMDELDQCISNLLNLADSPGLRQRHYATSNQLSLSENLYSYFRNMSTTHVQIKHSQQHDIDELLNYRN